MSATPKPTLTYAEYLAREATSEVKHEFINGEVYAMAGGSLAQGALAAAFIRTLRGTRSLTGRAASTALTCA